MKINMLTPARCSPPHGALPNLFPFISGNPLQALSVVAAFCGVVLLIEALLIGRLRSGLRLLRIVTAGVGIVSLGVALVAFLSPLPLVCGGIKVSANVVSAVQFRFLTLRVAVIALCIITLLLLLLGTMISLDPTQRKRRTRPRSAPPGIDDARDHFPDTDALALRQDQPDGEI